MVRFCDATCRAEGSEDRDAGVLSRIGLRGMRPATTHPISYTQLHPPGLLRTPCSFPRRFPPFKLTAYCPPLIALGPTAHCPLPLPTAYCPLPTAYCSLPIALCSLLTICAICTSLPSLDDALALPLSRFPLSAVSFSVASRFRAPLSAPTIAAFSSARCAISRSCRGGKHGAAFAKALASPSQPHPLAHALTITQALTFA
jgi:hypothetical protein